MASQQDQLPKVVIFLDIDGVLYNPSDRVRGKIVEAAATKFNVRMPSNDQCSQVAVSYFSERALGNLHQLLETDMWEVDIVISSSWKDNRTTDELKQMFSQHEFSCHIVDRICDDTSKELRQWAKVKQLTPNRGAQVAMWLEQHGMCYQSFVIFDDVGYWFKMFPLNFVKVDENYLLTEQDCKKASQIFEQHTAIPLSELIERTESN